MASEDELTAMSDLELLVPAIVERQGGIFAPKTSPRKALRPPIRAHLSLTILSIASFC